MALQAYTHESCVPESKIQSACCIEMSQAEDSPEFTEYVLPSTVMAAADVMSVYIGVNTAGAYTTVLVPRADWHVLSAQTIKIDVLPEGTEYLHNRVIFVPYKAFNLCFTGIANTTVQAARPLWVKRELATRMYDYLAATSIDYYGAVGDIQEYAGINFLDGVGTGFSNLTSDYIGAQLDFDGQFIGNILDVTGVSSLTIDSAYSSVGPARSFVYNRAVLDFALDLDGAPGAWTRRVSLPVIDSSVPLKLWVRDFKTVSASLNTLPNFAIRLLGTEFIL